jgi:hypothetical protein
MNRQKHNHPRLIFVKFFNNINDPNEQHAWVDEPLEKMYEMDMPPDEICVPIGGWSGRGIEV